MGYLADRDVNRGRQPEIDCLKAMCIVPMILLHTYENCAAEPEGFFHVLRVLETLTGAAAFMLCMGLGMRYSRHQSPKEYVHRGLELLTLGQLLNLLRDAIPCLIAWWCTGKKIFLANSLLVIQSDVLSFAGFAFLLLAVFSRLKVRGGTVFAVGLGMNVGGFLLSGVFRTTGNYLADQALGFFIVTDAESYFPLCSYFVFVALGYWLGEMYPRIQDKDGLSARVVLILGPIAAAYYILRACVPFPGMPGFLTLEQYVMNPGTDALASCCVSLFLLALFHRLLRLRGGQAPGFVSHLSGNITQYFCLSYLFLTPVGMLLLATRGYLLPGAWIPLVYGIFVLAATSGIIEWNNRHRQLSFLRLEGRKRVAAYSIVWILTFAILIYVYPKVEAYATLWNDYLMMN